MKKQLLYLASVLILFMGSLNAQTTISINPSMDNTLYEDATGSLSNGAGDHLFVGNANNNLKRRALLKFDIASNLPQGAIITSVTLTLTMDKTISGASNIVLHTLSADWGEGASFAGGGGGNGSTALTNDATWLHTYSPASFWVDPGGDFSPVVSASTSVNGNGIYTWSSSQMKTDVQNWLNTPSINYGWFMIGDEITVPSAKRFYSKETGTSSNKPNLSITYSLPCTNTSSSFSVVAYNSYTAPSGSVYNTSQLFTDTIPNANGCDSIISIDLTIIDHKKLQLKAYLEGFWNGVDLNKANNDNGAQFQGDTTDMISITLREPSVNLSLAFNSSSAIIETMGNISIDIPLNINSSYYIIIKHRNHVETWSSAPVSFANDTIIYDFTTAASQAYGNNQIILAPGIYGIYVGDVNQDGLVDGSDMSDTETDNNNFVTGYVVTDVNGDGLVDGSDMSIVETANNNFVSAIMP